MDVVNSLYSSIPSCFTILLILTSTMFAVSQYYDNRQRTLISQETDELWEYDLKDIENNPRMSDVKEEFDRLTNLKPVDNQIVIIVLWILLFFIAFLFMLILIDPYLPANYKFPGDYMGSIAISSIYLFIVSCILTINLVRMRAQLKKFRNDIESFNKIYEAVINALAGNH